MFFPIITVIIITIATVVVIIIIEAVYFIYLMCEILTQPCKAGIIHLVLQMRELKHKRTKAFVEVHTPRK